MRLCVPRLLVELCKATAAACAGFHCERGSYFRPLLCSAGCSASFPSFWLSLFSRIALFSLPALLVSISTAESLPPPPICWLPCRFLSSSSLFAVLVSFSTAGPLPSLSAEVVSILNAEPGVSSRSPSLTHPFCPCGDCLPPAALSPASIFGMQRTVILSVAHQPTLPVSPHSDQRARPCRFLDPPRVAICPCAGIAGARHWLQGPGQRCGRAARGQRQGAACTYVSSPPPAHPRTSTANEPCCTSKATRLTLTPTPHSQPTLTTVVFTIYDVDKNGQLGPSGIEEHLLPTEGALPKPFEDYFAKVGRPEAAAPPPTHTHTHTTAHSGLLHPTGGHHVAGHLFAARHALPPPDFAH